jgi:hypothetical protein
MTMANQPGPGQKAEEKDPKLAKAVPADPMGALAAAADSAPPLVRVQLDHAVTGPPSDQRFLWTKIREGTRRLAFPAYEQFITRLFCVRSRRIRPPLKNIRERGFHAGDHVAGVNAYQTLTATEAFLLLSCGVLPRRNQTSWRRSCRPPSRRAARTAPGRRTCGWAIPDDRDPQACAVTSAPSSTGWKRSPTSAR